MLARSIRFRSLDFCSRCGLPPSLATLESLLHTGAPATASEEPLEGPAAPARRRRPAAAAAMQNIKEEIEDLALSALPPHHRATRTWRHGRFDNPWPTWEDRSFADVFRWTRERRKAGTPGDGYLINVRSPTPADYLAAFPPAVPDAAALAAAPPDAVQATWAGHACVLVQLQGLTFLTDPVFAERCSPLSFAGPRRVVPPALTAATLPHVDAVLISHNHYDHLCDATIKALVQRFGPDLRFYVPLGLAAWFRRRRITNVVELDWWDEVEHGETGVRVVHTPAQHWSMRGVMDRKTTLWGGWALVGGAARFWFAGDTGFCPVFKEIGERLGPFDLCAIPTGAYSPRWFMRPQHIDPREAVAVHRDVRSRRSFAIHLATYPLTDEPMDEPVLLLERETQAAGLEAGEFVTLRHGAHIATVGGVDRNVPATMPVPVVDAASGYVPAV